MPDAKTQRIPQGLLGFLELKNGGQNPGRLLDSLQATWDLERALLMDGVEMVSQNLAINAVGPVSYATLAPGAGEWLALHALMIRTDVLSAGEAITLLGPHMLFNQNATLVQIGTQEVAVAAGQMGSIGFYLPRPFLMPPGTAIAAIAKAVTVQADTVCSILFSRLPV